MVDSVCIIDSMLSFTVIPAAGSVVIGSCSQMCTVVINRHSYYATKFNTLLIEGGSSLLNTILDVQISQ